MLITKNVSVNITNRNKKYFLEKGYSNSINGNTIEVSINDLPINSSCVVKVKCDYSEDEYEIRYVDYMRTKHEFINKDACKKCWHKKRKDINKYKINNNMIDNPNTRGYWSIEENIKNEINEYIKKNGYIGRDNSNNEEKRKWDMIHWAIKKMSLNLDKIVKELGYNIETLRKKKPNGYVMPFEELSIKINNFVEKYGFFPDQKLLSKELKIHNNTYIVHGTLPEIREKLGYNKKTHLVDNRGYINKSSYELITANYLISQGIPYKREQYPFKKFNKNLNYKSDFTFYLKDKEIHLEVWGGMHTFKNQRKLFEYEEVMKEKLRLYDKYNIELISVMPDIFYYSMKTIKKKLYEILSPYLDLPFLNVKDRLVSTYTLHEMSDEKLLLEIMKFSKYINILPSYGTLRKNKHEFLYVEVLKRFDSLEDFALKFNLITAYKARSKKYNGIPVLLPTPTK